MSRLHLVLAAPCAGRVTVEDLDGRRHDVSLLAYEGPPPHPGDWLVVHSGFALAPAEAGDAEAARSELRAVTGLALAPGRPDGEDQLGSGERNGKEER